MKIVHVVFVLSLIVIFSCKPKEESIQKDNRVSIKTEVVKEVAIKTPIRSSGKLFSKSEMKLSFKTGGIIRHIYTDEGDEVVRGQILAQLDLSEIQAQVDQANLGYLKAKRDFERAQNLYEDSVATLEQFQNAKTALDYAKAKVQIAEFNLQYSNIKSPSKGKILKRLYEENELIAPGYPLFLIGSEENNWVVRAHCTDKDIVKLHLGDTAYIYFDAFKGEKFKAEISEIGSMADPYSGAYEVELRLNDNNFNLSSGFIAKVEIFSSKEERYFRIPIDAMLEGDDTEVSVYLLVDEKPLLTNLKVEEIRDGFILTKSGIKAGDVVITDGAKFIDEESILDIQ